MADMLRVTTPLTGQEKTGPIRSNVPDHNTGIHNVVNPNRVSKGDGKTLYNDNQEGRFSPNLKSNFESFLQKLSGMPSMSAETAKLFFTRYGSIVSSGMNEGIAAEMSQYLEMMKVGEKELLDLLKGMQGSSVKFTGSFFDVLRNVLNGPSSGDVKNLVLEFLRKYDALTGSNHTLQNIMANLNSIADRMRKSSADELRGLIGKLNNNVSKGDIQGNLAVIKEDIIPLLSKYMTQTRDFGAVRDYISLFVLNLVRYESGGKEGFSDALNALLSIPEINSKISNKMVADLVDGIFSNMGTDQAKMLSDQLVSILTKGLNGQAGYQNTAVFENILQSALINQSVYMPLLHMMFPADYNGSQMFSEIWVDPDSKDGNSYEGGNAVKLLVKFDIRDVGFFEMIMLVQNGKVDMQLFYPENLEAMRAQIKDNIFRIVERNDLTFRSYMAEKCEKPKAISEVFRKLYEGRNMINVVI